MTSWLTVRRGNAPLIVSFPHTGTDVPAEFESRLVSPWIARKDADWWIDKLYDFASDLDATIIHTAISRTVIDVQPARHSTPGSRPPNSVRPQPSMANRSTRAVRN